MKILLSIHKKYIDKIILGTKKFELRKRFTNKKVNDLYFYETAPTKKVVAVATIKKVHKLPIKELWKLTKTDCGVTREEFFKYFKNAECGYAIELKNVNKFKRQKLLSSFNINFPPQSFQFIKTTS